MQRLYFYMTTYFLFFSKVQQVFPAFVDFGLELLDQMLISCARRKSSMGSFFFGS